MPCKLKFSLSQWSLSSLQFYVVNLGDCLLANHEQSIDNVHQSPITLQFKGRKRLNVSLKSTSPIHIRCWRQETASLLLQMCLSVTTAAVVSSIQCLISTWFLTSLVVTHCTDIWSAQRTPMVPQIWVEIFSPFQTDVTVVFEYLTSLLPLLLFLEICAPLLETIWSGQYHWWNTDD